MSSDHEADTDLEPWMCSEVERRIEFHRRQVVLTVAAAAASGFALSQGWLGVWFGATFLGLSVLWARVEVEDACAGSAWDQHEYENGR